MRGDGGGLSPGSFITLFQSPSIPGKTFSPSPRSLRFRPNSKEFPKDGVLVAMGGGGGGGGVYPKNPVPHVCIPDVSHTNNPHPNNPHPVMTHPDISS